MPLRTSMDGNSVTSAYNIIPFQAMSVALKECYAPRLQMTVTYVDCQANIYTLIRTDPVKNSTYTGTDF